ncbi:MAG: hypothetical protein ACE5K4_10300 [Candidatus Hydrothermarchaeota archaeon]
MEEEERLRMELDQLTTYYELGKISDEEYERRRREILDKLGIEENSYERPKVLFKEKRNWIRILSFFFFGMIILFCIASISLIFYLNPKIGDVKNPDNYVIVPKDWSVRMAKTDFYGIRILKISNHNSSITEVSMNIIDNPEIFKSRLAGYLDIKEELNSTLIFKEGKNATLSKVVFENGREGYSLFWVCEKKIHYAVGYPQSEKILEIMKSIKC